jgi:hypothetical protein
MSNFVTGKCSGKSIFAAERPSEKSLKRLALFREIYQQETMSNSYEIHAWWTIIPANSGPNSENIYVTNPESEVNK